MKGKIISWDTEKEYGFIKDKDGNKFFLHKSEVKDKNSLKHFKINSKVFFKQKATSRGMRAIEVKLDKQVEHFKRVLNKDFVVRNNGKPRGELVFTGKLESQWHEDRDTAKDELIALSKELGFNSLYNLEMVKEKRSRGNYIYSVYAFNADVGLLIQKTRCKTKHDTEEANKKIEETVEKIKVQYDKAVEEALDKRRAPNFFGALVGAFLNKTP